LSGDKWSWDSFRVKESSPENLTIVYDVITPDGKVEVTKEFTLLKDSYELKCKLSFRNLENKAVRITPVLFGGMTSPWHLMSGDKPRGNVHRLDYLTADGDDEDIDADEDDEDFFLKKVPEVVWSGAGNKYFCNVLATVDGKPYTLFQYRSKIGDDDKLYQLGTGAQLSVDLAPNGTFEQEFKLYSGPKAANLLKGFSKDIHNVMHMAWGPLDYLARFLLWLLGIFYSLCRSYGVSIILLTLLVRSVFYPITAKGNESMKKMQKVQPKFKELKEQYKDNPQLLNQKMTELYRQEGINPLAGCLPILLQIPIFFALYAMLDNTIELRHVSFLWCKNLAAADTVAVLPLPFGWSLPINPLVLAMTALMVIQQRMTPAAMDPTQKKMMALMPIVMLIFLYDLPSGLTLYWTVSNIFSIVQLWLQKRKQPAAGKDGNAPKTQGN
jgi:YidC/Oxa1 family membrane protein insertase